MDGPLDIATHSDAPSMGGVRDLISVSRHSASDVANVDGRIRNIEAD